MIAASTVPNKKTATLRIAWKKATSEATSSIASLLASAIFWLFGCLLLGSVSLVAGVYVLTGIGWSLITAGALLFLTAGLIHRGIAHG